jgi:hypothetical protein
MNKKKAKKRKRCLVCTRALTKKSVSPINDYICRTCMGEDE